MAFTVSTTAKSVFGNQRVVHLAVTADANSGVIVTGLSFIYGIVVAVKSAGTNGQNFKANLNAAAAAANGSIMASSCASGEEFYLTVFGV